MLDLMTTPIIGEGEKIITTVLLNGERIHVRVHAHACGQNVFEVVVNHIGLNEVSYFGLMIIKDGEQQFLNLEEKLNKLSKYAPHLWKDDGSCNSSLVFTLFFRVKYYTENICLLQEQCTRHQYYLQLRKDVLENSARVHDDTSMVLASYALQSELGDYDKSVHGFDYFIPQHYLPAKTIAKLTIPYIKNALPAMHQSHRGLSEGQAEIEFLKEAQKLSEYGVLFHRVYKKQYNKKVPYNLGICLRGLVVYEETGPVRNPVCKHPWSKVKKMSFKRSKFIVESECTNINYTKMTFYTTNYKRSRYLLNISSSFFNFQMMVASRIAMLPDQLPPEDNVQTASHQQVIPSLKIEAAQSNREIVDAGVDQSKHRTTTTSNDMNNQKEKPKCKTKPEVRQYTLELLKRDGSFGFSIVGGIELGGIFVKDVTPGGPAAVSGMIHAGDRIVQINKDSFENVTRREAINTLWNAPDRSKFIMETFGQNLIFEADTSIVTPLAMSAQSLAVTQPQVPVPQTERESEFIRVDIPKKDNSLGIGFTGGPELGGVYIKSMMANGAAEMDGKLAVGDRLVEIDKKNVEGFTRKKIHDLLKQSHNSVAIIVERYQSISVNGGLMYIDREKVLRSNQNYISIILEKKNDSLGFSITGGSDIGGIYVKFLNPNGPASSDGRLEVGDRVVAVNDISLETVSRPKALEIIRNATPPIHLMIEKCLTARVNESYSGTANLIKRSESIKSLPTNRASSTCGQHNFGSQSRNLTNSMQNLQNPNIAHNMNANYGQTHARQSIPFSSSQGKGPVQDVFVVDLNRVNGSFGISLTGGHDVGGIYIKAVQPDASADIDGRIMKGDKVIEINARRMDGLSKQDAIDWLKSSELMATFVLERIVDAHTHQQSQLSHNNSLCQYPSFDGEFIQVELHRRNQTYGLNLLGGPELRGIFVKNLLTGGSASNDGRIAKGDRIVEINAVSLDGLSRQQVIDLLKDSGNTVILLIEKIHNLSEVPALDTDTYSVELRKNDSGFGFSITGGPELGGVYIKGILPGGAADGNQQILKGDRLLEVNGVSLDGLTKQQVSDILRKSPPLSNLLLEHHGEFDNMILPESEFFTVELHKKYNGYGLSLTGGPEIDGVYVKQVQRDSTADQDGRIKKGDRLITINGRNVEGSTKQKCTEMLKLSQDIAVIHFERCVVGHDLPPLDTVLTVVKLTKNSQGFGISLAGGIETGGIFVKALLPGGVAEKDGRILIGDRVAEINSVPIDGFTRQQATDILKNSPATITFVLERYKQMSKSIAGTLKSRMHQPPHHNQSKSENFSPSSLQQHHFTFPLYNGAAPSVPPRHLNNGIPSRESAFKRLEQQQLKISQQNDGVVQPSPYLQTESHNSDGSQTPSRVHTQIHRQDSLESNALQGGETDHFQKEKKLLLIDCTGSKEQYNRSMNEHNGSLSMIETPMRMFIENKNELVEDSPQRFLQQFSRSVVSSHSAHDNTDTPTLSRIPHLGPISSAIFGNTRDNRNVHELLDPGEKTLEDKLLSMNENERICFLRANHPELLNEYRSRTITMQQIAHQNAQSPTNQKGLNSFCHLVHQKGKEGEKNECSSKEKDSREAVIHLSNGKSLSQQMYVTQVTDIANRPAIDPNLRFQQTPPNSIGKNSKPFDFSALTNNPMLVSDRLPIVIDHTKTNSLITSIGGSIITTSIPVSGLVKVLPNSPDSGTKSHDQQYQSKRSGGLQWASLDESGSDHYCIKQVSDDKGHKINTSLKPQTVNKVISSPKNSNSCVTKENGASSKGIPVPLASRFNTSTSHDLKRSSSVVDGLVFEVILVRGAQGLGMNLTGGGTQQNPVTIKKIATGTSADEQGQLCIGDILLEVNGKPVTHMLAKEVISMLRLCTSEVHLLVKRMSYDKTHYHITATTSSSYIGL